ncbi:Por secretion system C-terminal sorting domain-containing protein, partial [Dyadobacter sp. SG02]|uniref:T9SS type A sorting domain-containing protein n=1 Tax=Dyadobacter sp. SG02 TaxID=1855291 RepID=UPI0008B3F5FA
NILGIPVSADVRINNNAFNFSGMETNISRLDSYAPQALIKAYLGGPLCIYCIASDMSVWTAGGTKAKNTYKLYKNNVLIQTLVGKDILTLDGEASYYAEVTNSDVPGLTLRTQTFVTIKLPVTLITFEGQSENNQTKLTWKTAAETNNKGFEIERSADAGTFEKIGFVDGNGDSKEVNTYHYTDLNPFATTYYRLKQLDYDGKSEYSKIIRVKASNVVLKVYPNPAQEYLIVSGISQKQSLSIIDQNGRVVLKGLVAEKEQFNIGGLSAGRYIVNVGGAQSILLIHR